MTQIGKMNRRPTFQNLGFTQDAGGGSTTTILEEWEAWAEIIDTNGSVFNTEAQEVRSAGYKVTVRFDGRFRSITRMIYEGQICKCESLNVLEEGNKRFLVLRYTKTDTWVDLS